MNYAATMRWLITCAARGSTVVQQIYFAYNFIKNTMKNISEREALGIASAIIKRKTLLSVFALYFQPKLLRKRKFYVSWLYISINTIMKTETAEKFSVIWKCCLQNCEILCCFGLFFYIYCIHCILWV